jgi:antitoxin component of MazEF toxin-antitoxin module
MTITAKIRKIGNSKGILFPKEVLEESGIKENVRITVKNKSIVITQAPVRKKKEWTDFKKVKSRVPFVSNTFDETEWTW